MRSFAVLLLAAAAAMVPKANTHHEIAAYVERAAAVVHKHGPSCETFARPEWKSGDWYIFVLEPNGRTVCHPARPDLVGTSVSKLIDPNGKHIGDEFVRVAKKHPSGAWVNYVWARPGQTKPVAKSSYVRLVKGPTGRTYIVGSGGYELR